MMKYIDGDLGYKVHEIELFFLMVIKYSSLISLILSVLDAFGGLHVKINGCIENISLFTFLNGLEDIIKENDQDHRYTTPKKTLNLIIGSIISICQCRK